MIPMEKYTEEQLLDLLAKDWEAGAEAVWEMYSGLIWRVCARRLQNEEDVKESVNSTFADFCMNWRQYDPAKGTLRNYICTIGDRKAVEYYRKNDARHRAEEKAIKKDAEGQVWREYASEDDRIEKLQEALKTLSPLDEKILRMKYYDGMTFKEIAAKMELPYDTVKKRGERSLKKLWKILIVALLLAALTGCTLWLYRYFRFTEKGGINWNVESPLYEMEGEGPYVEANGMRFTVEDATYQDGTLVVKYSAKALEAFDAHENVHRVVEDTLGNAYADQFLPEGGTGGITSSTKFNGNMLFLGIYQWETEEQKEEIYVHIENERNEEVWKSGLSYLYYYMEDTSGLDLTEYTLQFDFTLKEVEFQKGNLESLGEIFRFDGGGFMVRDGKVVADGVMVPLYSFDLNADYTVSDRVVGSIFGYRNPNEITLIAESGEKYPMTSCAGLRAFSREARELLFEGAPAGDYTLRIPYLIMNAIECPEGQILSVPEAVGETVEPNMTFTLVDGTKVTITRILRTTNQRMDVDVVDDVPVQIREVYPELILDYEITPADGDVTLAGVRISVAYEGVVPETGAVQERMSGGVLNAKEHQAAVGLDQTVEFVETGITIKIEEAEYVLEKQYDIAVTIE